MIDENIYAVANESIMDAQTFCDIMRASRLKYDPVNSETVGIMNCAASLRCTERIFDNDKAQRTPNPVAPKRPLIPWNPHSVHALSGHLALHRGFGRGHIVPDHCDRPCGGPRRTQPGESRSGNLCECGRDYYRGASLGQITRMHLNF